MHASFSSRRFARISLFMLTVAMAIFQASATSHGWHAGRRLLKTEPPIQPTGRGWFQIAEVPGEMLSRLALEADVALWWNPAQSLIVLVTAFGVGLLLVSLSMAIVRAGLVSALRPEDRDAERITAAIHYGTAWAPIIAVGLFVGVFAPIARIGDVAHWSWYPSRQFFEFSSAVLVAFGAVLWWFWMLRLAYASAPAVRVRVTAFSAMGLPLIAGGATSAWWFGLDRCYGPLFELIGLAN